MNQVLHILRKDIRRYWPESMASLAATGLFTWNAVRSWRPPEGYMGLAMNRSLQPFVSLLLPIAWWLLVVRVIQGESLVGDRQFWITRPYDWKKLLAAKVVFILLFINLPFLIMQAALLGLAGFDPLKFLPELLMLQIVPLSATLPVATLATVTSSFGKAALAAFMVIIYISAISFLASQIPSSSFSSDTDGVQALVLFGTCLFVIWLQYSSRSTSRSRWVIAGFGMVMLLLLVATPYRTLIAHNYTPIAPDAAPIKFAFSPPAPPGEKTLPEGNSEVEVHIPLNVSGLAGSAIARIQGNLITIEDPSGFRWNQGWKGQYQNLFPDNNRVTINFQMPHKIYERMRNMSLNMHVSLAIVMLRDTDPQKFITPRGKFTLPAVGTCTTDWGFYSEAIHCMAPLRQPSALQVSADASQSTCPLPEKQERAQPGTIISSLFWSPSPQDFNYDFDPVQSFDIYMTNVRRASEAPGHTGICPGTPLVLSRPVFDRQFMLDLSLDSVRIDDYRPQSDRIVIGRR